MLQLAQQYWLFDLIILLLVIALVTVSAQTLRNPVVLIIIWLGGWLCLADSGFSRLFLPSGRIHFIVVLFLSMFGLGAAFQARRRRCLPTPQPDESRAIWVKKMVRLCYVLGWPTLIVVVFFAIRAILIMQAHPMIAYKYYAFAKDQFGELFMNRYLLSLYFVFIGPVILLLTIVGTVLFVQAGYWRLFVFSLILNFLDGFLVMGRTGLYTQIIVLLLALLFVPRKKLHLLNRRRMISIGVLVVSLFVIILVIGSARGEKRAMGFKNHLMVYGFEYHTLGFVLFDTELKDPNSHLNQGLTYGRLTFGGIESLITLVIRQFDREYTSPAYENLKWMFEARVVGQGPVNGKVQDIGVSSFYTSFYSLYRDGREVWTAFVGFVLGFLLIDLWRRRESGIAAVYWMIFLTLMFWVSLFVSSFENMRTWLTVMLLSLPSLQIWWEGKRQCLSSGKLKS
jgi:oligosaccharide repeat unit polymerase